MIAADHPFRFEYYKASVLSTCLINCTTFVELGIHRGTLQFPFPKVSSETVEKDEFGNRVLPYPLLFKFVLLGKINFSSVGRNDAVS